jgi:hypothetical protein
MKHVTQTSFLCGKLPQNVVFMRTTCVSKHEMWTAETSNQCYLQAARVCGRAVTEMLPRTMNCCRAGGICQFSI